VGRFQSQSTEKVTTPASFLSPGCKKKSNPRVTPSGSNPIRRLPQRKASGSVRWRDATLAAREASKRWREVAAWHREVTVWRRESSLTSSSCSGSSNSAVGFSPVSAFHLPSPSFPSPVGGMGVELDLARPSRFLRTVAFSIRSYSTFAPWLGLDLTLLISSPSKSC
jgi:hypothetical protein